MTARHDGFLGTSIVHNGHRFPVTLVADLNHTMLVSCVFKVNLDRIFITKGILLTKDVTNLLIKLKQ